MVTFTWTNTDTNARMLITQPRHNLEKWTVINKPNSGIGCVYVVSGPLPTPPAAINRILMLPNVVAVMALEGRFFITVKDPTCWVGIQPEIESILAVELKGHLDDMDNAS